MSPRTRTHIYEGLICQTGREQNTVLGILRWIRRMDTGCRGQPLPPTAQVICVARAAAGIGRRTSRVRRRDAFNTPVYEAHHLHRSSGRVRIWLRREFSRCAAPE